MTYIKEYWQNKEQRATIAREHTKEMRNKYGRCIQTAISATKIYDTDSFNRDFEEDIEDKDTKIIVENIDSVGAVMKYGNPSTAVLNFSCSWSQFGSTYEEDELRDIMTQGIEKYCN